MKAVDAKVSIDGVGLQADWSIYEPSEAELRTTIKKWHPLDWKCRSPSLICRFTLAEGKTSKACRRIGCAYSGAGAKAGRTIFEGV